MNSLKTIAVGLTLMLYGPTSTTKAAVVEPLNQGRYIGYILQDSTQEKLAVVADIYLESPNDLTLFPSLNILLKFTFGGYNTHEYYTTLFKDIHYDFNNGTLTLEDPKNDFLLTGSVKKLGSKTFIDGTAFVYSTGVSGQLYLEFETDEPPEDEDNSGGTDSEVLNSPFIPLLQGQYEGKCGQNAAAFQIQSVRGLEPHHVEYNFGNLNNEYGITGHLAFRSSNLCTEAGSRALCRIYSYPAIEYNPSLGTLTLQRNNTSDQCTIKKESLTCRMKLLGHQENCEFRKVGSVIKPSKFYSRKFHTQASAAQMAELPPPNPPNNSELAEALRGVFTGFLHNETNDQYQLMRLTVLPYSSTTNPHNPNQMMINSSASLYLGRSVSREFYTQRFEPRSFYTPSTQLCDIPCT